MVYEMLRATIPRFPDGRRPPVLATLIDDLLAYTRAGVVESAETPVDSSAVLRHTRAGLWEAIRESGASVTQETMPEVWMSEAEKIFQNLISNAVKYRAEAPRNPRFGEPQRIGLPVFGSRTMASASIPSTRRRSLVFSNGSIVTRKMVALVSVWQSGTAS